MTLILLNGPMGCGKTAVSRELVQLLQPSVFLDGDWCWDLHPLTVTDSAKRLVVRNIRALLSNFAACPEIEYIVCCWVLQYEETARELLTDLAPDVRVLRITLDCSPKTLSERIGRDIADGKRDPDALERSLSYLPLYRDQQTLHISTDARTPREIAREIAGAVLHPSGKS